MSRLDQVLTRPENPHLGHDVPGAIRVEPQELVVHAGTTNRLHWRDLWRYGKLFYILAW